MVVQIFALLGIVTIVYVREHGVRARNNARADVMRRNRRRLP